MYDINYLKINVRGSIISDVVEVAKHHSVRQGEGAGWFGIPRQVFCYVDFLGAIAYNNIRRFNENGASTRKAVRFIKEFFPTQYSSYANLLIFMWRHGTVHHFKPSSFYTFKGNRKIYMKWTSNRSDASHNREVNMNTFKKRGNDNWVCLSVNICQLADDLLYAFDNFIKKIETKQPFKNWCLRRINGTFKMTNCMSLKKVGKSQRKEIRKQILYAHENISGILDKNNQVEWFTD